MPDDPNKVAEEEEEIADEGTETEADEGAEPDSAVEDEDDQSGDDQDQGDHAEADARGDEGAGRKTEVTPKRSSASDVIREQKRRAQEAERRAEEAERRARDAEARAEARRSAESEAEEQRRLEIMTPEERADYRIRKTEERLSARLIQSEFRAGDAADKADFRAMCREDSALAAVAEEVEAELLAMRRNGQNVTRENLANFLIGKHARERAKANAGRQKKRGAERIASQTTRPGRAGSDVAAERQPSRRGDTKEARDARLEGKTF